MPKKPPTPAEKAQALALAAGGIAYGDLCAKHDDYDAPYWREISDFCAGGRQLEKRAGDYMRPLVGESAERYQERLGSAGYINYHGQIVGRIAAATCSQMLTVRQPADAADPTTPGDEPDDEDEYTEFSRNVDGAGTSLNDFLHDRLIDALNLRTAFVGVDFPQRPAGVEIASRADEEAFQTSRPFAVCIPRDQVIDWDEDDDGGFRYLVIHRIKALKAPPGQRTNLVIEEFKIWEKLEPGEPEESRDFDDPDGDAVDAGARIVWRLHRIAYDPKHPPKSDDIIPLVAGGSTSFKRIPVLPLTLKEGLWAGNKLVSLSREHWSRRATLVASENRNLVPVPVLHLGSETGAPGGSLPSQQQQNPHRGGRGPQDAAADGRWIRIGKEDAAEFVEPEGRAYELTDKQLAALKDEMFRVVDQMAASVDNTSSVQRRSGESKKMDRSSEAIVYGALGHIVREFGVLMFRTISEARGENVVWNAHGMDDYEIVDREALIDEAQGLDMVAIPSVTFRKTYKTQVALALIENADVTTKETIRKEIEAGVVAEESMRLAERDVEHDTTLVEHDARQADANRVKNGQPPAAAGRGGGGRGAPARPPPRGRGRPGAARG